MLIEMEKGVRRKEEAKLHSECKLSNKAVSHGSTPSISGEGIKMFCVFVGLGLAGWSWLGSGCFACLLLTTDFLLGWQQ